MKKKLLVGMLVISLMGLACAACSDSKTAEASKTIHVSPSGNDKTGDGSEAKPYASIEYAASKVEAGTEVLIHEGEYKQFEITSEMSGTAEAPVVFRAAEGETVVIKSKPVQNFHKQDSIGIHILNAEYITIEGFELTGGTHGIYYESTQDRGDEALRNITINDCTVHKIRGTHGICVYARNDYAPVKNITMSNCHVYDCECDSSESTVFNGNIDGFTIKGNVIHDNNNIGIDMIGFEGNARHIDGKYDNEYDVDFVRNGVCHDNVVYNISAEGNEAYLDGDEYDLCADGIYVDGGQDIEIYNNFIFNCNIGIEVATEHKPSKNPLFKVSGIDVHDNVVAACEGWCGMCWGGYDKNLGFTENCKFHHNTFIDNGTQIGVQRSLNNTIYANLFVGGDSAIEFNYDCREKDLCNDFAENAWYVDGELIDYIDAGDYDLSNLVDMKKQIALAKRGDAINMLTSQIKGYGSEWVPAEKYVKKYLEICE